MNDLTAPPLSWDKWKDNQQPIDRTVAQPAAPGGSAEVVDLRLGRATEADNLAGFVRDVLIAVLIRRVDGRSRTWCLQWWEHPEAVWRLLALHDAYVALLAEPGGLSCWLRDHADYHLPVLLEADGVFRGCSPERGHQPRAGGVAWQSPPIGWTITGPLGEAG